jgi:hypothetical protein
MKTKFFKTFLCLILCSVFFGCQSKGVPTVPVEIVVTYKGEKVEGALVTLNPMAKDGSQRTAAGMTDVAGRVAITTPSGGKGAMEGDFKITVIKSPSIGGKQENVPQYASYEEVMTNAPKEEKKMGSDPFVHLLPVKYASEQTTDLQITVKKGNSNSWTFNLID